MNSYDIIVKPILSEKSNAGIPNKVYTFEVSESATKTQIKMAVEEIFSVKVIKVNTVNYDGKVKRRGRTSGRTPSYKKAYVTLSVDSKPIELLENLA
jgi:large subunit ribosomal protein L23